MIWPFGSRAKRRLAEDEARRAAREALSRELSVSAGILHVASAKLAETVEEIRFEMRGNRAAH